jgi:protein ImuB
MFACLHVPGLPASEQILLLECAAGFSPKVEPTAPDAVTLALEGLERLFGSPPKLAREMARRAADLGWEARVAVASNPDAALAAARGLPGVTVIPAGREAEILAPLPVAVLEPAPEIAETLARWGIRRLGELAALPQRGLAERLGSEGVRLQERARGAAVRALAPVIAPEALEERLELEHPAALLEPLLFLLARLLEQLCRRLQARALAALELRLQLDLEEGGEHLRVYRLPVPMRAPGAFLKLLRLDLEAHPPRAAVRALRLAAGAAAPRSVQHGLFVPRAPEPEKLELTLARLAALVGEDRVGAPELLDTHRPDAFRLKRFTASEPCRLPGGRGARGVPLALRRFRPPLPARVEAPEGRPRLVLAQGVHGRVVEVAGPWRVSGEWWRAEGYRREEFDVALSDGGLYRIYRDGIRGGWFVEGSYD